jgi:hypothetical protein
MDTLSPVPDVADAAPAAAPPPPARRSWRRRHPVIARSCLYGLALAMVGAGWAWWAHEREAGRQDGLMTILHGAEQVRSGAPGVALATIREQVLARDPRPDVRRSALLAEAATLDELARYEEAESAYGRLSAEWPAGLPRGPLVVPWAGMRVHAKRPAEALALLDAPGATDGWGGPSDVALIRAAAAQAKPAGTAPAPR